VKICGIIPVRLNSSRFPGKSVAKLQGKEVILHTYDNAKLWDRFDRLIVATEDQEIKELVEKHGGDVVLSDKQFQNGSERCADAAKDLDCDIVVNIQGDEIFVSSDIIEQIVELLEEREDFDVATAVFPLPDIMSMQNTNLVKVAVDKNKQALAFSRRTSFKLDNLPPGELYGHGGIYAFRADFLQKYAKLEPTENELEESLEQIRILDSGFKIGAVKLKKSLTAINVPNDLLTAERVLAERGVGS